MELVPLKFHLSQNYPNPFGEETTIKYCNPVRTRIVLRVLSAEREELVRLVDEVKEPGTHEIVFRSMVGGAPLARGTYLLRLEAGDYANEKEMLLSR